MSASSTVRAFKGLFTRNRELFFQFTVRAVELRHRGSHLGILWAALNPLFMLALYVVVFGYIFGSKFNVLPNETKGDFALAVFAGLILFHVLAEAIAAAPTYVIANMNLVKKVVFPLEVLPVANVTALWFHALVSFVLLLLVALFFDRVPTFAGMAWLPVILLPHYFLTVGVGLGMAAFGVFFRDVSQLTGVITQVLLYASAVFLSPVAIQHTPWAWAFLRWNPMLQTIDLTRRVLLWDMPVDTSALLYTWAFGLVVLWCGAWFFKKTQSAFADVI